MTIFDCFDCVEFRLVELERGAIEGLKVKRVLPANTGVFIENSGLVRGRFGENLQAQSILYVRPTNTDLVGYGVAIDGVKYEVVAARRGKNQATGATEHIKLTLERAGYELQNIKEE